MINPFKRKPKGFNIHHPDFINRIEKAFKSKGVQYYRFKEDTKMPYGRYQVLQSFLLGYELRMDYALFKAFLEEIEKNLNGTRGQIDISKAFVTLEKMKARAALAFDPTQAYSVASVIYFQEDEDLYHYDNAINQDKIARWKGANLIDFFYMKPIAELLGLSNFSQPDLIAYIKEVDSLLSDLTLDTQPA
jgi:hypothetical protein